jgi:nitric oxide dioxygenase
MLNAHPELHDVFSRPAQLSNAQPQALAGSILAYAEHVDNLAPLVPVVERITSKHAALGIRPEHYAIVAEHLFDAFAHVLGSALTADLKDAWFHVSRWRAGQRQRMTLS